MKAAVVFNGWTARMSGGDYHALRVGQQWSGTATVVFVMPMFAEKSVLGSRNIVIRISETLQRKCTYNLAMVLMLTVLRAVKSFIILSREKNLDAVVCSSHFPYDTAPAFLLKALKPSLRYVVYYHGLKVDEPWRRFSPMRVLSDALSLKLTRNADVIFSVHPKISRFLEQKGINRSKIHLTSNGVDQIRDSRGVTNKIYDACFLGRVTKSKGALDLPQIWRIVVDEMPDARLAIIGAGPALDEIANAIPKLKLCGNVDLLGYLEAERFEILDKSKMLLFPSYGESWPIALAEGMSRGLPVVAYDLPELHEIWGDSVLTYAKLGDKRMFASLVSKILGDTVLFDEMANRGLKSCSTFTWERVADEEASFLL